MWLYSSGKKWIKFDNDIQNQIECFWSKGNNNWINSKFGYIYIDINNLNIYVNGYFYDIVRNCNNF
jgi:hypothetical protein